MSDYISRQEAIKVVKIETNDAERLYNNIVEGLRYIPSADVVEVVRCRDCYYSVISKDGNRGCKYHELEVEDDDYCSCGERAEG